MAQAIEPSGWMLYDEQPTRGRSCGACKMCCTEIPVELPIGIKPSGTRCPKLRSKGCSIYPQRPQPCQYWSCRWLFDPETAAMRRPDLVGYIVDPQLAEIVMDGKPYDAVQVWIDPARPGAHEDPALRIYLGDIAERLRILTLLRWRADRSAVLSAPCLTASRQWEIRPSEQISVEAMAAQRAALEASSMQKPPG